MKKGVKDKDLTPELAELILTPELSSKFIEDRLKLKVNKRKSAIGRPWERKFLGFSFYTKQEGIRVRIHPRSIERVKEKIRFITSRSNAWS